MLISIIALRLRRSRRSPFTIACSTETCRHWPRLVSLSLLPSDFDQILEVVGSHIEKNFNGAPSFFCPSNGGLAPRYRSADLS
jgi:hypothetical protein